MLVCYLRTAGLRWLNHKRNLVVFKHEEVHNSGNVVKSLRGHFHLNDHRKIRTCSIWTEDCATVS